MDTLTLQRRPRADLDRPRPVEGTPPAWAGPTPIGRQRGDGTQRCARPVQARQLTMFAGVEARHQEPGLALAQGGHDPQLLQEAEIIRVFEFLDHLAILDMDDGTAYQNHLFACGRNGQRG